MSILHYIKTSRNLPTIAYSLGLGLIALAVTAIWIADSRFLADQHRIGAEVNLAGRQRMLSQRIGMIAQDMDRFERVNGTNAKFALLGCADQMMRAHVALRALDLDRIRFALADGLNCHIGKPEDLPAGDLTPGLQEAFFGGTQPLDDLLEGFVEAVRLVARSESTQEQDIERIVQMANMELPLKLNSLVRVFQKDGEDSLHDLDRFITAMWVLTLLLIVLEVMFIFRPMARKIRRTMDQLHKTLAVSERRRVELKDLNDQLLESIHYARKIQMGAIANVEEIRASVKDAAMLWEPLQVVSGDFVWSSEIEGKIVFFVADCTGHGVPGALLTMVVSSELKKLLDHGRLSDPETLMLELDRSVRERLGQDQPADGVFEETNSDDGFEAALAVFDRSENSLTYVGAGIPLFIRSQSGIQRIPADRHRLGYRSLRRPEGFTVHRLPVAEDETFYMATDGATDHVGGEPKRAFGRKRLFKVLESNAHADLETQLARLKSVLTDYRGTEPPRDDYTVLAVKPRRGTELPKFAAE